MGQCKLASKVGGSGGIDATLLWTNPSPSSSIAQQSYALSDNITNYDYFMIVFAYSTTDKTESSAMFKAYVENGAYCFPYMLTASNNTNVFRYYRPFRIESEKSLKIVDCGVCGNTGTDNAKAIPLRLYGIKGTIKGI